MTTAAQTPVTCASCRHIGRMYWDNGFSLTHFCDKSDLRRKEGMSAHADFFDHFRTFFDATADQKACLHYDERQIANANVLEILNSMEANKGRGEFGFWSDENALAHKLDGKFVKSDMHAQTSNPGNRVFWLLPVGAAEIKRAAMATGAAA